MELKRLERLVKFLELLASDQDGEVLNAARMAAKIVKEEKLAWGDIVKVVIETPRPTTPPPAPRPQNRPYSPFEQANPFYDPYANMYNQQSAYNQAMNNAYYNHQAQQARNHEKPNTAKEAVRDTVARETKKRNFFNF